MVDHNQWSVHYMALNWVLSVVDSIEVLDSQVLSRYCS